MGNYYQPEIETMPVEKLQALQSERLVEQVKYVYDHVEFYRNKMKEAGVEPEDIKGIEDLHKLPFVTKDDLRDQYPYGFLGVPLSECVRMQSTSGTTGRRVVAFYTQEDIDVWEDCCARAIMAEQKMMYAMQPTVMDSLPAEQVCMEALIEQAV